MASSRRPFHDPNRKRRQPSDDPTSARVGPPAVASAAISLDAERKLPMTRHGLATRTTVNLRANYYGTNDNDGFELSLYAAHQSTPSIPELGPARTFV